MSKARSIASLVASVVLAVASVPSKAACGNEREICAAGSPWYSANGATLRFQDRSTDDYGTWVFSLPEPISMAIDTESLHQGKTSKGKILLVGGRVMLTKDLELEKGYEIDALDGAALLYQLVISLLSQALPEGPEKLKDKLAVNRTEAKRGIKIATSSASGFFPPPWKLTGAISRKTAEVIAFSFDFDFPADNSRRTFALTGEWRKTDPAPSLDPKLSLEGWKAYALGPITIKQEGGTIFDYGAQATPTTLRTLGELQESIRKNEARSNNTVDTDARKSGARGSP